MQPHLAGVTRFILLSVLVLAGGRAWAADVPCYDSDIQAILKKHCVGCHGEDPRENQLDLRNRDGLLRGGKTGPAVVPGSLRESLMWGFLATDKMPAGEKKLSAAEKTQIREWILAKAPQTREQAKAFQSARSQINRTLRATPRTPKTMADLIDQRIRSKLDDAKVTPAPLSDDAEFLRRVYLDLNGRVPSFEETTAFLNDKNPRKRERLIESRLASNEFGQHLGIIWHKLLIPKSAGAYSRIPHQKFRDWLATQFNQNQGWDATVTELVTAEGYLPSNKDTENNRKKDKKLQPQNIATAFLNVHNTEGRPQPKGIIASVSRLFLGQSIECAQCHNHPLAKWEQTDFWAAAAFFERVRYDKAVYGDTSIGRLIEPTEGSDLVYDDKAKARYSFVVGVYPDAVIDLQDGNGTRTGTMIRAKFFDGPEPKLDASESYRTEFAAWMTAPENPFFAKALVNRMWSQLMGRGFVEPVDDLSEDNLPSHPELLADLSDEFIASGYNVKHLITCICNSETYQRASRGAKADSDKSQLSPSLFAQQSLKQFTEDQLIRSLEVVLPTFAHALEEDARDKNPGLFRKAFLEVHETGIDSHTEHTRGLQQALRMMNGDGKYLNRDAIAKHISEGASVSDNIRNIYLQALNRPPTAAELKRMAQYVETASKEIQQIDPRRLPKRKKDQPDNTPDPYADVLWVLINSGEFIFNH